MNWNGERVLVTGAGGFIASHLVEALVERGATVRAFVHYRHDSSNGWLDHSPARFDVEVVAGDIRDFDSVAAATLQQTTVFNLAALISVPQSLHSPQAVMATNAMGTLNLLQLTRSRQIRRFVQISSSEVYGTAQYTPIDEGHPIKPQSPYAASKAAADCMIGAYHASYQHPVVTVRPFNTFGPRQSQRAIIVSAMTQALKTGVVAVGNPDSTRDFVFVSDTVDGLVRAAEAEGVLGETIQLATGTDWGIQDVGRLAGSAILNRECRVTTNSEVSRRQGVEVERLVGTNAKANELLGWQPRVRFTEGLKLTAEWLKENREFYPKAGTHVI